MANDQRRALVRSQMQTHAARPASASRVATCWVYCGAEGGCTGKESERDCWLKEHRELNVQQPGAQRHSGEAHSFCSLCIFFDLDQSMQTFKSRWYSKPGSQHMQGLVCWQHRCDMHMKQRLTELCVCVFDGLH